MDIAKLVNDAVEPLRKSTAELAASLNGLQQSAAEFQERQRIAGLAKKLHISEDAARNFDPASVRLNDRAELIAKQRGVSFAEALQEAAQLPEFADAGKQPVPIDQTSVVLNAEAERLARTGSISFAEALPIASHTLFGDGVEPAVEEGKQQAIAEAERRESARDAFRKKHGLPGEKLLDSSKGLLVLIRAAEIESKHYDRAKEKSAIEYGAALEESFKQLSAEGWPGDWMK